MSLELGWLQPVWTLIEQQPLAQGIGLAAMLVGVSAFLQQDDSRFRWRLCLYQGAIAVHFLLMGASTAALSAALSCGRTIASGRTRNPWVMLFFLVLVWVLGIPGITSAVQWLPIIGTTIGTWGLFRARGLALRLCMLAGGLCWTSHNILIGSIGGSLIETTFLFVNCHTMYRMWRHPLANPL
ncbi:YgjV family protein [Aeromonas sp. 62-46]|uniref:YgjV family protein n=1 Tax=Aeromonas sp. 62-46 TaxID=1895698 RepID=UPI000B12AA90|nr:YgjV family protein [Aeromonas sp. 62-46]